MNIDGESARTCNACGAELQPGNRFCANCGAAVVQAPEEAPQQAVAEPLVDPSPPADDVIWAQSNDPEQQESQPATDPSSVDTHEFTTIRHTPANELRSDHEQMTDTSTSYAAGDPEWGTPETTVPPERGNRTLWIILGIFAVIILICCCILPLGLMAIANWDTEFQDELRSAMSLLAG